MLFPGHMLVLPWVASPAALPSLISALDFAGEGAKQITLVRWSLKRRIRWKCGLFLKPGGRKATCLRVSIVSTKYHGQKDKLGSKGFIQLTYSVTLTVHY